MKKKILTVLLAVVAALCLCFGLAACGASVEGKYYLYEDGKYDKTSWIELKNGTWETSASGGEPAGEGDYELNGDQIVLYIDLLGSKQIFSQGTVKDGVLTLTTMGVTRSFYKEGAAGGSQSGTNSGTNNSSTGKTYTVTYNANGGAFTSGETFTQTAQGNSTLTAPTSPSRQNYTFAGWAKNKGGTEMWDFSNDKVTGNTTLYAMWTQKSATVLSVEGASIDGANIFMLVTPQTSAVQLASKVVCSDDSYWQLYYDALGQTEIPTKVAANLGGALANGENVFYIVVTSQDRTQVNTYILTVYRQYTVNVTYMTNGTVYNTREIVTGTPLTQSYDILCSVRGYTFNGWKHTEKFGDTVWGPVTFTADLTANTYKLRYDANGGEGEIQGKEVKMDATTSVSSGAGFKRKYYTLSSFNTQADGRGETVALGSSMKFDFAEDTTLYAIWDCDYNYTSSSNGITITGCKRSYSNVDFTDEFDGKPVVAIASQAFKNNTALRQIVIPDSVKSIGAGAFSGCSSLTSMTIPFVGGSAKKATDLYQYPFGYIFGTTSYTGGTAVKQYYYGSSTSDTTTETFYIPTSLKSVTVTGDISSRAFYNCIGLTSVTIGDGVTEIGEDAFYNCSGLTRVDITDLAAWCKIDFGNWLANPLECAHHLYLDGEEVTTLTIPKEITQIAQ